MPPFAELLAQCTTSVLHLETRDVYADDAEVQDLSMAGRYLVGITDRAVWWGPFQDTSPRP